MPSPVVKTPDQSFLLTELEKVVLPLFPLPFTMVLVLTLVQKDQMIRFGVLKS